VCGLLSSQYPELATRLKNQRLALEPFCLARGLANVEVIVEIGGRMNVHRKNFLALMDAVESGISKR
jgi:putative resolvase